MTALALFVKPLTLHFHSLLWMLMPLCFSVALVYKTMLNEKMGLGLVILDYAVLAPEARGRGIGSAMMGQSLASLSAEFSQVELRTSHKNYAALSLYTKYGFRVLSSDFIFHRLYR